MPLAPEAAGRKNDTATLAFARAPSRGFNLTSLSVARVLCLVVAAFATTDPATAADKVTFATNWLAEAEHGGFYQAVADGTYAHYGLDVRIMQGGPQTNSRLLLATGKVDFDMGGNLIQAFDAVAGGVPIVAVAAMFQKDPFILMSHPGVGLDRLRTCRRRAPSSARTPSSRSGNG
jgi:NitT/TauT family transport system substrate-binding protein